MIKIPSPADILKSFCYIGDSVTVSYDASTDRFSAVARDPHEPVSGYGATPDEALVDLWKTNRLNIAIKNRVARHVCIRTDRDGKFVCENYANAAEQNGCAVCLSCQRKELEAEGRAESAEAARIERDYR